MSRTRSTPKPKEPVEATSDSLDWFVWDTQTLRAEGPFTEAEADSIIEERLPHKDPSFHKIQLPV